MVHAPALKVHATLAEYLEFERNASDKHEYYNGVIYGMAGGTPEHGFLAANIIRLVGNLLENRPCVVATSDVRIRVVATGLNTYPDASVTCDPIERAPDDPHAIINPTLLVEVLSDATEAYDRGEKFAHYRRIPTLREYVLVSQNERRIEVYQRDEANHWVLREAESGQRIALASLDGEIAVDEVYRNVALPLRS